MVLGIIAVVLVVLAVLAAVITLVCFVLAVLFGNFAVIAYGVVSCVATFLFSGATFFLYGIADDEDWAASLGFWLVAIAVALAGISLLVMM
jgi:fatty acid desaturase